MEATVRSHGKPLLLHDSLNRGEVPAVHERLGGCLGELDDILWVRHHRHMTTRDFNGRRSHALGEETLGIGRDGLIVGRHHVPGRQRLPGGTPITSPRVDADSACWTANMTFAFAGATSAAKYVTKSSSGIQAKPCSSMSRCASAGVGGPCANSCPIVSPSSSPKAAM